MTFTEDEIFELARNMRLNPCRDRTDGGVTIQTKYGNGVYNRRFNPNDNLDDYQAVLDYHNKLEAQND